MGLKFNIDRPKVSDEEIKKQQDFNQLVQKFKEQSIKKARGDESWWKNKKVHYSAIIAGVTVVCTITYLSLYSNQQQQKTELKHEKINTLSKSNIKTAPKTAFVKAPSPKLQTEYSAYKVSNSKGATLTHANSSKIKIPVNSFVDKSGRDVIGDVTIEYREFHHPADVIANGIPMAYDSAGHQFNLESAGMFDIRGSQNGEPVFIKPDKTLLVELASVNNEDRFNQYYLDTVARNWQYLKRDNIFLNASGAVTAPTHSTALNKKIRSLENEIEMVIPHRIDSVKTTYNNRIQRLPQPAVPAKPTKAVAGRPTFKLDGSYDEFPELSAFKNVLFEVGPENRNYNRDVHEITWSDVKISQGPLKGRNYLLELSHRNVTEKLIVYPVLNGTDYEQALQQYDAALGKYQELAEKRLLSEKRLIAEMESKQAVYLAEQKKKKEELESEKARLLASFNTVAGNQLKTEFSSLGVQAKTSRLFEVGRFGIFNSDHPHPKPQAHSMDPRFIISGKGKALHPQLIYMIDHTKRTVYVFNGDTQRNIAYEPGNTYSFCLFRNNELYLCGKENVMKNLQQGNTEFQVEAMDESININEFRKALEI